MPICPAWASTLLRAVVVGGLYAAAYRYAVFLRDPDHLGASFWPGAGIAVAALLLFRRRDWPAILSAVAIAQWASAVGAGVPTAALTTLGNVTVALATATLATRWGAVRLSDAGAVLRFAGAVLAATSAGGLIGAAGIAAAGAPFPYLLLVAQWVAGDAVAILTIVPAALALAAPGSWRALRQPEALAALGAVSAVTIAVFAPVGLQAGQASPFLYLVLPPLMWAALRLPLPVAAGATFIAAQIANFAHALGHGPIAATLPPDADGRWQLQLFLAVIALATLATSARTHERNDRQQLLDARERLLASVSHELRSPLTPILGFSDLPQHRTNLDPQLRQAFEVIHRNANQLNDVIGDLLTFTRGQRNRITPAAAAVDLAALARQAATDRRGTLAVDAPDTVQVWADPTHAIQVVTNLVNNALTHGRQPVTIAVAGHDHVGSVTVTDSGDGVPDEFIAELFEEFAQHPAGHTDGSLGLGLAIAHDLAHANGGQLQYRHHPDGGAEFRLELPTTEEAGADVPTEPQSITLPR